MADLAKLDASLILALKRRERAFDPTAVQSTISVVVRFRDDIAELHRLGFQPSVVLGDEAIGTVRFADLVALAASPNVLRVSAGTPRRRDLDTAVRDIHARASSAAAVGTDGVWYADERPAPGAADPNRVLLTGTPTGKGVIIAVLDSGIDVTHPMFHRAIVPGYDSRVLRIWDMSIKAQGTAHGPNPNLLLSTATYGVEFDTPAINSAINGSLFPILPVTFDHRDCDSHGTHVASIAAGGPVFAGGADATRVGVAPEADIIAVKLLDLPGEIIDVNGNVVSPDVQFRDAIIYCCRIAKQLNKALVINTSFGGNAEAGDGLDDESRWLDRTFDPAAAADDTHFPRGAILVRSAGNNGNIGERTHARVTVPDSGTVVLPIELFDERGPNRTELVNCVRAPDVPAHDVVIWYREVVAPQDVSVAVRAPTEQNFSSPPVFAGVLQNTFDGNKVWTLTHSDVAPVPRPDGSGGTVSVHRNNIVLNIAPNTNVSPPQHLQGIYELRFQAPPGTVLFAFCERNRTRGLRVSQNYRDGSFLPAAETIAGSAAPILPVEITPFGTVNPAGRGRHVITVGAYHDTNGITSSPEHHALLTYSSRGPQRDFSNPPLGPLTQKPDLVAPGAEISAALTNDGEHGFFAFFDFSFRQGDRFTEFTGTSQAAPMVAGTIALMLQKKKDMSVSDVRAILTAPANVNPGIKPSPGNPGYAESFGAGRLDVRKVVASTP